MPHLNNFISDVVRGESRLLAYVIEDMEDLDGDTLSKAYLTVKANDTDPDEAAIFQIQITPVFATEGQIDIVGGGPSFADGHMYFLLSSADTLAAEADVPYHYDVLVFSSGGAGKVVDAGRILFAERITQKDS